MFWDFFGLRSESDVAIYDDLSRSAVSYGELRRDIERCSESVVTGEKLLAFIFCDNSYTTILAYLSALSAGHAVCLLDRKLDSSLCQNLLDKYKPELMWGEPERICDFPDYEPTKFGGDVEFSLRQTNLSYLPIHKDTAVLLSTSGTTGSPQFVRLSYDNIQSNAESIAQYLRLSPEEKPITLLPMHYSYGLSVINSHLCAQACLVCTDKSIVERPFWDLFREQSCTSFAGVPHTFGILKRIGFSDMDTPSLRYVTQAGGSLDPGLTQEFYEISQQKNFLFYVMYGQTEASPRMSYVPYAALSRKIGSIGVAIPRGSLEIVVDAELETAQRNIGDIVYRGPNVMMGYAEKRKDLSKGDELGGTLYTGDIGYCDEDGYFYLCGRRNRIVKIFGQRINLDEVEEMLQHHFNKEAACFGREDNLHVVLHSCDERDNKRMVNKIMKLYHIHHSAIRPYCLSSLEYGSSEKKDYRAIEERVNSESN